VSRGRESSPGAWSPPAARGCLLVGVGVVLGAVLLSVGRADPPAAGPAVPVQQRVKAYDREDYAAGLAGGGLTTLQARALCADVADLKAIMAQVRDIHVARAIKDGIAKPAAPSPESSFAGVIKSKCAKCHNEEKAKGGLKLVVSGELVHREPDQWALILGRVGDKSMPPPETDPPLPPAEFDTLMRRAGAPR